MKRILLALLLFPQIVFAQYSGDVFTLDSRTIPTEQRSLRLNIQNDTVISLGVRGSIYGLSVTGTVNLENDQDSYVRVILRDDHNYEYLVYECFPLLTETLTPQFQNTALETKSLDGITPQSLRIELLNASINLDSFAYVPESEAAKGTVVNSAVLQREQVRHIADMMNDNLVRRDLTWRAGVTSIAEKIFEEKKAMFGGRMPQLYGFDYYVGGIFIMPSSESLQSIESRDNTTSYVNSWDWRDRHGRNWMTEVQDQLGCGSCGAFSAVGTLEAYINLYYNRILGINLSEEEMISCVDPNFDCYNHQGLNQGAAFSYIMYNGIVDELCFPYVGYKQNCVLYLDPSEKIYIQNHNCLDDDASETEIKQQLFKAPMTFSIESWNHGLVLAGFKKLQVGDVIYISLHDSITITNNNIYKGRNAWLLKNSWGTDWGNNGYAYVVVNRGNQYNLYYIGGDVTRMNHFDSEIVCEDRDGDGYYFWGVREKLSSWPSWIPDSIDGNDNDPQKGKLYLESPHVIGELETINPNGIQTLTISSNTTYTTRQYSRKHIVIPSNKTLTVKNILNMFGRPTITVQSGGQLIVDGGVITNANINLTAGAKLVLKNGGKIVMRTNTSFNAPVGALVDITNGEVIRSNDF